MPTLDVSEAWPEHAGHDVQYTEVVHSYRTLRTVYEDSDGDLRPSAYDIYDDSDEQTLDPYCCDCDKELEWIRSESDDEDLL